MIVDLFIGDSHIDGNAGECDEKQPNVRYFSLFSGDIQQFVDRKLSYAFYISQLFSSPEPGEHYSLARFLKNNPNRVVLKAGFPGLPSSNILNLFPIVKDMLIVPGLQAVLQEGTINEFHIWHNVGTNDFALNIDPEETLTNRAALIDQILNEVSTLVVEHQTPIIEQAPNTIGALIDEYFELSTPILDVADSVDGIHLNEQAMKTYMIGAQR